MQQSHSQVLQGWAVCARAWHAVIYRILLMQENDQEPLLSHDAVISTMEGHHRSIVDTVEAHSQAALRELRDKTVYAHNLEARLDGDIKAVCPAHLSRQVAKALTMSMLLLDLAIAVHFSCAPHSRHACSKWHRAC